jgi:hypothetical protein
MRGDVIVMASFYDLSGCMALVPCLVSCNFLRFLIPPWLQVKFVRWKNDSVTHDAVRIHDGFIVHDYVIVFDVCVECGVKNAFGILTYSSLF